MARLITEILSGNIKKIMETGKGYFINGHYYTKGDLSPSPLNFYNISSDNANISTLKRSITNSKRASINLLQRANIEYCRNSDHIIIDKNDHDIFYIITEFKSGYSILKTHEKNGVIKLLGRYDSTVGTMNPTAFLSQTDTSIVVSASRGTYYNSGYANSTLQYLELDKQSFKPVLTKIADNDRTERIVEGYRLNDDIYYEYYLGAGKIRKIGDMTILHSLVEGAYVFYNPEIEETAEGYNIYTLDSQRLIRIVKTDKNYTSFQEEIIQGSPAFVVDNASSVDFLNINDRYLAITQSSFNHNLRNGKIFIFDKIDKKVVFEKDVINSTHGSISSNDNSLIVFSVDDGKEAIIFRFNQETVSYEEYKKFYEVESIGFDLEENIIICYKDGKLEMLDSVKMVNVSIKFNEVGLIYENQPINTSIKISALLNGELIESTVTLHIKGNASFANDSKALDVNTVASNEISVPITITGIGEISIFAELN